MRVGKPVPGRPGRMRVKLHHKRRPGKAAPAATVIMADSMGAAEEEGMHSMQYR